MLAATNIDCLWVKDFIPFHCWSFVTPASAFTFPGMCTVPVHTHPAVESCFAEAHNSQRSGCPQDYLERSVPPSPVAHRFSLRWQRTERGQPRSHANLLRHLRHLNGEFNLESSSLQICTVLHDQTSRRKYKHRWQHNSVNVCWWNWIIDNLAKLVSLLIKNNLKFSERYTLTRQSLYCQKLWNT